MTTTIIIIVIIIIITIIIIIEAYEKFHNVPFTARDGIFVSLFYPKLQILGFKYGYS